MGPSFVQRKIDLVELRFVGALLITQIIAIIGNENSIVPARVGTVDLTMIGRRCRWDRSGAANFGK